MKSKFIVVAFGFFLILALRAFPRVVQAEDAAKPESDAELFVAKPFTEEGLFLGGIEGPACDAEGNVYACSFKSPYAIGKVTPDGKASTFIELPNHWAGNGIVFDRQGLMYVANPGHHSVLRIDPRSMKLDVFARDESMYQPNDIAIGPDETIYLSDPNFDIPAGRLWKVDRAGKMTRIADNLGDTNGLDVSPDGKTLYVGESVKQSVWAFPIKDDGTLGERRLLIKFPVDITDGLRCDVDGNIYVTRHLHGTVAKLSPEGKVLREIDVLGAKPSNICFGGPDGRTAYVTEVTHGRLVTFRVDRPGLAWQRWQEQKPAAK